MKVVIIEDEKLTAEDLAATITRLQPAVVVQAILYSVQEAVNYFSEPVVQPDLIFSDIQLGDGTSFEIFSAVSLACPVIFCTAYDEFALEAFRANGIDYILKPFTDETIQGALNKYHSLKATPTPNLEEIMKLFSTQRSPSQGAVLVHYKDTILPIAIQDIAFFFLKNGVVHFTTLDKKNHYLGKTLDELEKTAGSAFFRVNRQYLVNRKAIVNASSYSSRKLSVALTVPVEETVLVSKEKMPQFLHWLTLL